MLVPSTAKSSGATPAATTAAPPPPPGTPPVAPTAPRPGARPPPGHARPGPPDGAPRAPRGHHGRLAAADGYPLDRADRAQAGPVHVRPVDRQVVRKVFARGQRRRCAPALRHLVHR